MSDDTPVCTITDAMLSAGKNAAARLIAEGCDSVEEVVALVFISMLSQMEGGDVLFAWEGDDSPAFRFRPKGVQ